MRAKKKSPVHQKRKARVQEISRRKIEERVVIVITTINGA
jgi:hypothetical protein